jgi:lipoprotein-releasing system permease protein
VARIPFEPLLDRLWPCRFLLGLRHAAYLAVSGLVIGNIIGIILLGIQHYFAPIALDPSVYYVSTAPVDISFSTIVYLNIMTLAICLLVLIIPSYLIAKISPVKVIKFD